MTKAQALKEFRLTVKELAKVKTKISNKRMGAGLLIVKASKADEMLSRVLSTKLALLSEIIGI